MSPESVVEIARRLGMPVPNPLPPDFKRHVGAAYLRAVDRHRAVSDEWFRLPASAGLVEPVQG